MAQVTPSKTLLITGVSRGFGFALAAEAVAQGYQVLGIVRNEQSRLAVLAQLPTVQLLVADITAPAYENLLTQFVAGKAIDVLINNAGSGSKGKTLATTTAEQLQREFNTHCVAAMLSAKVCQPTLIARNGQLINISSRRGSMNMQADGAAKGAGCSYSYRIGKAAQNMLTLSMADEFDGTGVTVCAVHPGRLLTTLGASDAHMSAQEAAQRLVRKIMRNELTHRQFYNLEGGDLPW